MKIFNQSGRIYTIGRTNLLPGQFTEIPEDLHAEAEKVLAKWGHELITAETASKSTKGLAQKVQELTAENATLKKQVDKLQAVLLADDKDTIKELDLARESLAVAQRDLRTALETVHSLQNEATLKDTQITGLTADLEQRTRPAKK